MNGVLYNEPLYTVPRGVVSRWASPENPCAAKGAAATANHGRKGAPNFNLAPGASRVLAEASGASGIVRRIWLTHAQRTPPMLRSLRLQCFWDGARRPAVDVPLGDFFGFGLGRMVPFHSALLSSPEGRSFNCCFPMPFRRSMRIVLTNESPHEAPAIFYDVDFTLGDKLGRDTLYFHAWFNRENPTTLQHDYQILARVNGRGRFLGAVIGVAADTRRYGLSWWGEGECKIYLDGDRARPTLCGTGTEDYIGTAWCQGRFDHLYQGCHLADPARMHYAFYRFHIPDPVFFHKNIRVCMQQIGCWDPPTKDYLRQSGPLIRAGRGQEIVDLTAPNTPDYGLFERQDDWSSCAYFYLNAPENELPGLAPVAQRTHGLLPSQP